MAEFIIERDGEFLARYPDRSNHPFGRALFQNLQYSDTPTQPLVPMRYHDATAKPGVQHRYRIVSVNTARLKSQPSPEAEE